jgi:hypothetical protein
MDRIERRNFVLFLFWFCCETDFWDDKFRAVAHLGMGGGGWTESNKRNAVLFLFWFCCETDFCVIGLDGGVQLPSPIPSRSEGVHCGLFCRLIG